MKSRRAGFSLFEVLTVIAIVTITSSVALVQMRNTLVILDADKASNLVVAQSRYARQIAVDQRRNVVVDFIAPDRIRITRQDGGGATTVMSDVFLPAGFTFSKPGGVADTPDGYGNATPVYFNGNTSGVFLGDGIFVDGGGIILNGSVFTMRGSNVTARAVTLTGASGRTKQYFLQGSTWVEK